MKVHAIFAAAHPAASVDVEEDRPGFVGVDWSNHIQLQLDIVGTKISDIRVKAETLLYLQSDRYVRRGVGR